FFTAHFSCEFLAEMFTSFPVFRAPLRQFLASAVFSSTKKQHTHTHTHSQTLTHTHSLSIHTAASCLSFFLSFPFFPFFSPSRFCSLTIHSFSLIHSLLLSLSLSFSLFFFLSVSF